MEYKKLSDTQEVLQAPGVSGHLLSKRPGCEILHIAIQPGKLIPNHVMDVPGTFTVVQGKGQAVINGQTFDLEPGTFFEIEQGVYREWRNTGDEQLVIISVKYIPVEN